MKATKRKRGRKICVYFLDIVSLNGMLNSETIKCSQELDRLLNAFKRFQFH